MNHQFFAYGLFYTLGLAFWLLNMNGEVSTLLCVFYSIFVGTVWGWVPRISGSTLNWKHMLPPFVLLVLMMLSVRLNRMIASSEVVWITAMALIHFRACILSFTRLRNRARIFSWIQLASFVFGLVYLFQRNVLSTTISRNVFLASMMGMSTLSIAILWIIKRKSHESKAISP